MTFYSLVSVRKTGVKSKTDIIHVIEDNGEQTVCEEYHKKDLKNIRFIPIFNGENNICPHCKNEITDLL